MNTIAQKLKIELASRCVENPQYSLRAFAKYLEIDPSVLSKFISSKRKVSSKYIKIFESKLGWDEIDEADSANLVLLKEDQLALIEHWYHYAILELTKTKKYNPAPNEVAKRLGITVWEATDGIERLKRLDLLSEEGKLKVSETTTVGAKSANHNCLKKLQKEMLAKASLALDLYPIEQRDQSTMIMAIKRDKMPRAKKMLKKFRRDFCEVLEQGDKPDSVYHLSMSFYPVTKENL